MSNKIIAAQAANKSGKSQNKLKQNSYLLLYS